MLYHEAAPDRLCHWWPRKGTSDDWAQYTWDQPVTAASSRLYWFDDTGFGECRPPVSWKLEYLEGDSWRPVRLTDPNLGYSVAIDRWVEIEFEPVKTTALRLSFEMQKNWSVGIHQWQVFGGD